MSLVKKQNEYKYLQKYIIQITLNKKTASTKI